MGPTEFSYFRCAHVSALGRRFSGGASAFSFLISLLFLPTFVAAGRARREKNNKDTEG